MNRKTSPRSTGPLARICPEKSGSDKITSRQQSAVAFLLVHPTIAAAAEASGTHERTLRRWLAMPAFQHACRQARTEALGTAIALLASASADAVGTLKTLMADQASPPPVKLAAARWIIELARRGHETDQLEVRLSRIEEALRNKGGQP